jgi:hypothetical protein
MGLHEHAFSSHSRKAWINLKLFLKNSKKDAIKKEKDDESTKKDAQIITHGWHGRYFLDIRC